MRIIENIKSIILTGLIISSLILTGSLWFDNYQGLSFAVSKIPDFFSDKTTQEEYSKIYEEIIMPYKVTVINPDESKWISYCSDKMNLDAWNILKSKLSGINEETEIITGKIKEWDELINRKSIILEFGGTIDRDIFYLAIPNLPKNIDAFNNVEKISITKSLEGNTIYIIQSDENEKKLYKILLKGEDEEIKTFMQSCENIKADVKYVKLEDIGITNFYNNKEVKYSKDVLFPISNKHTKRDTVTSLEIKEYFDNESEYQMNRMVTEIFNNTDFAKFITNDNSKIYINDDKSSIKIESTGIVEYINNGKMLDEENLASKNLNTALDFINDIGIFDNFFLHSAEKQDELYVFKFSVAFDGVVCGFSEPIIGRDRHAIMEIRVQNNDIRYFKGKLLELKTASQKEYISTITHNIMDNLLKNVESNAKVNITELEIMYDLSIRGNNYPVWFTNYSLPKEENLISIISVTGR